MSALASPKTPVRDPRSFGCASRYGAFDRGFGTAPRFVAAHNRASTPGPFTSSNLFTTADSHQPLILRGPSKAQCFDTKNPRFLMNEAILSSRQGLADPRNPGPGSYELSRQFGVSRRQLPSSARRRQQPLGQQQPLGRRCTLLPAVRDPPTTVPELQLSITAGNHEMLQRLMDR